MMDRITGRWHAAREGGDRGDVPGWVLVTLMTAGLVLVIWGLAGPALGEIFSDSVQRVTGGIGG